MQPEHWVHDLSPFLIRLGDSFGIRYYGLAYILGFLSAIWLLRRYAQVGRSRIAGDAILDLMVAIVAGVVVGGRLGYFLLYQPGAFFHDPLALLRLWEGGMASHGGFIGVAIALGWYAHARRISFLHVSDVVVTTAPVGLFFGRVANFINGELWGKVTDVPWAVIFPLSAPPGTPPILIEPRHPSQLYQAALEGLMLLAFIQWRFWRSDIVRQHPGRLSGEFLVAYAVLRMVGEMFREPDASLLFGVSRGTFYSVFLILAGVALIIATSRRRASP